MYKFKKIVLLAMLVSYAQIGKSQTLSQKLNTPGSDMTAADLTAVFLAEIKSCEDTFPNFKKQVAKDLSELKNTAQFKKIIIQITPQMISEANEYVASKGKPSASSCEGSLKSIGFNLSSAKRKQ